MKKVITIICAVAMLMTMVPSVYASNAQSVLESDALSVMPKTISIDEDFVFVDTAPGGSKVEWSVKKGNNPYHGLFDENGAYLPEIGDGAFEVTLTATLSYMGETLEKSSVVRSFRTPAYKLNGYIYKRSDGSLIRHSEKNTTIVAADIQKNPRIKDVPILAVGVYEGNSLKSISTAKIEKSGEMLLDTPIGELDGKSIKAFLWNGFENAVPLEAPVVTDPVYDADNDFFKTAAATSGDGDDAKNVLDADESTYYRFKNEAVKNHNGLSMKLTRSAKRENQLARLALSSLTGTVDISYDFMITETDVERGIMYLHNTGSDYAFSLIIQGGTLRDQSTGVVSRSINPFRWYNLRAVVDLESQSADVYLDGKMACENMPLRSNTSEITKLQIHNSGGDKSSTMYIDNIKIKENGTDKYTQSFDGFNEGDAIEGWEIGKGGGNICASEFKDEELTIFPQEITIDAGREFYLSGVTVNIGEGNSILYRIETSRDNQDNFVCVASHMNEAKSGAVTDRFDSVRARYVKLWIYRATDKDGNYVNARINEITLKEKEDTLINVAPLAHVSVSSSASDAYDARGLIDTITASTSRDGEWICYREVNPKAYLSWDETQKVHSIELYGRSAEGETADSAEITFDDKTSIIVTDIPHTGAPKRIVLDTPKDVNYMKVRLFGIGKGNAGLSEIRVLTQDEGEDAVSYLTAWKEIKAPGGYSGEWTVSDDLDNDGSVDFVSARGVYENASDNHYVGAISAFNLDGEALWVWGEKGSGSATIGSDLPCQIYDIDNDGQKEVLAATKTELVILDGKTGEEEKRYTLPSCTAHSSDSASDSIIIADVSGTGYPSDIIVKTRYSDLWVYTKDWELLWHKCMPGGMKTAHAPRSLDIDNDGKDEVFAGFCLVDDDNGEVIWTLDNSKFECDLKDGHIDSFTAIAFEKGMPYEDMRFAITPCGARNFFVIDGNGKKLWESDTKIHYETLIQGKFTPVAKNIQLITNPQIDDRDEIGGAANEPIFVYDYDNESGECALNRENWGYMGNRYIYAVNMNGEYDYIYQPSDNMLTDGNRNKKVKLISRYRGKMGVMRWEESEGYHNDMDGDGTQDITMLTVSGGEVYINIYQNIYGKKTATKLGTGYNYSFY